MSARQVVAVPGAGYAGPESGAVPVIIEVRAYLDSTMVTYTVLRNEALKGDAGETVKPAH